MRSAEANAPIKALLIDLFAYVNHKKTLKNVRNEENLFSILARPALAADAPKNVSVFVFSFIWRVLLALALCLAPVSMNIFAQQDSLAFARNVFNTDSIRMQFSHCNAGAESNQLLFRCHRRKRALSLADLREQLEGLDCS